LIEALDDTPKISSKPFVMPGSQPVKKTPLIKDLIEPSVPQQPTPAPTPQVQQPAEPAPAPEKPIEIPASAVIETPNEQPAAPAAPEIEPNVEPVAEPTAEPIAAPAAEPVAEPVVELTAKPDIESTDEPETESDFEETDEPEDESDFEPSDEPVSGPVVAPTTVPTQQAPQAATTDTFETQWKQLFKDVFEKAPMIYFPLKDHIPTFENNIIKIEVLNTFQQEQYQMHKRAILEYWRTHFTDNVDDIEITLNEHLEVKKIIFTADDKFKNLKEQNPQITDFMNILNFKIKD